MKKFFAFLLAAMMLLSFASVAIAEEVLAEQPTTPGTETTTTVTVNKEYKASNSDNGSVVPSATFGFNIAAVKVENAATGVTVDNMPTLSASDVEFTAAGTKAITINTAVTFPGVGIYTYKITEKVPEADKKILGVNYDSAEKNLKITVVNGNNGLEIGGVKLVDDNGAALGTKGKTDSFTNTYDAGKLTISKTVTGNGRSDADEFSFTVTFENNTVKSWTNAINTTATQDTQDTNKYTFKLTGGQSIDFANIPYDISYTVVETPATGYSCTNHENGTATGTIGAATTTVEYINDKDITVDTGVSLDTLPYVLMLAVVAAGVVAMIAKKRRVED